MKKSKIKMQKIIQDDKTKPLRIILFVCLFAYLVLCNIGDWDFTFTQFEVDRRSWLTDFHLPLWSYQLCGGASRIGDPNALGLSPSFLAVLLFGSFWGAKIIAFVFLLVGHYFLTHFLKLFVHSDKENRHELCAGLSVFYIFGSYFLWHYFVGHLVFGLFPIFIAFPYFFVKSWQGHFNKSDFIICSLVTFTVYTGPSYHVTFFFGVPLIIILLGIGILSLLARFFKKSFLVPIHMKQIILFVCSCGIGMLLASYRLVEMVKYQSLFPREVSSAFESIDALDILAYQFIPTWDGNFTGNLNFNLKWSIWEYSGFSAIPLFFVFILVAAFMLLRKSKWKEFNFWIFSSFIFAAGLCFLFTMGDFSDFAPHSVLNQLLFHGAARVVGRYQAIFQFVLTLALVCILNTFPQLWNKWSRKILYAGFLLTAFSFCGFIPLLMRFNALENVENILNLESQKNQQMTRIREPVQGSSMYASIMQGKIILDCYQPLNRVQAMYRVLSTDYKSLQWSPDKTISIVANPTEVHSQACLDSIYLEQNIIHLNTDICSESRICFNLNMINPADPIKTYRDPSTDRYCWSQK